MEIRGTPGNNKFKVTYLAGGRDVTSAVTAGTYRTSQLAPAASSGNLVVKVTRTNVARPGDTRTFAVRAGSSHAQTARDTVAAVVTLTK